MDEIILWEYLKEINAKSPNADLTDVYNTVMKSKNYIDEETHDEVLNRLINEKFISKGKFKCSITEKGESALQFDTYREYKESKEIVPENQIMINNNQFVLGNKNKLNQSFRDSLKIKVTKPPSKANSIIRDVSIGILVTVIGGILLYVLTN